MIFLTAYSGESDKAIGYSAGADDYIVKPFSNAELLFRVKALLRRAKHYSSSADGALSSGKPQTSAEAPGQIRYQDLVLDTDSQSGSRNGEMIALTGTEFRILELLLTHRKKIYSLENIYQSCLLYTSCTENVNCHGCGSNDCPDNAFCENKTCSIATELSNC